jgi:hypothetical protein
VKQRVYFFLCGTTREMSFISRRTGSLLLAGVALVPFEAWPFAPFAGRLARPSSIFLFLLAGSELDRGPRLQTWREIWLKSSI